MATYCYADVNGRVCLEKASGKLVEYQSGNAALGTLTKNAIACGKNAEDVIEKYVTAAEWAAIEEEQLKKPAREKAAQKEVARKEKEEKVKTKLGLSNKEFEDLKEALE
jgi:hypothetical protein